MDEGYLRKSHPVRGAWIEISDPSSGGSGGSGSHPVRGAWIEIFNIPIIADDVTVASRKGCVD